LKDILIQDNVTPPSTTEKTWNLWSVFLRSDGWCCGNQTAASGWEQSVVYEATCNTESV
jgi:hypothetical protein